MTRPRQRLTGDRSIDAWYAKPYTAHEMRGWARNVERLRTIPTAELQRWTTLPRQELSSDQSRVLDSYYNLMDPNKGVKGELRPDGLVDLQGGRHRAAYMMEQGIDPVPVWVSGPDGTRISALREQCECEMARRERDQAHLDSQPGARAAGETFWTRQGPPETGARARVLWSRDSNPDREVEERQR